VRLSSLDALQRKIAARGGAGIRGPVDFEISEGLFDQPSGGNDFE
jgi:hypothetical protein